MDIGSKSEYPASALSNFAPHQFTIDGVQCNSMEGFLQSLKFKNPEMQKTVCQLVGMKAKMKGYHKTWWKTQTLYWLGQEVKRDSEEYQRLLDRAYAELAKNVSFKRALLSTGDSSITHSIGKRDPHKTVLTQTEFCSRLLKLRSQLKKKDNGRIASSDF